MLGYGPERKRSHSPHKFKTGPQRPASSPSKDNDTCPDCGCFEAELVEVGSAPPAGKDRDPMYDRLDGAWTRREDITSGFRGRSRAALVQASDGLTKTFTFVLATCL